MKPPLMLIVEDNDAVREAMHPWLADLFPDCRVAAVKTAAAGIVAARTDTPRVVVIDVRLPNMNGIEATRQIRAASPDAKVVIFTLCDAAAYRTAATAAGAVGYALKHRAQTDLVPMLRGLLAAPAPSHACRLSVKRR